MKVEILITDITNVVTKTKLQEGLLTTIQFDAKVPVQSIARLLNLQRQGAPLLISISSPQAAMDLFIQEDKGEDITAPDSHTSHEQEEGGD